MDSRVSSRQDYINYLLGYPNTVKTNLALYSGNCTYTVGNRDVSNLKVRLIHKKNSALPDVEVNAAVPNQELIDFEKYVLGVVYAENGGAPDEAMKAQAIAARTYAFNRGTIKEDNGEVVLEISSSTWDQTYCDPDKGCDICTSALDQSVQTVMTKGTVPEGASCTHWKGPLENDSRIRKAVKAVSGIILTDTSGNPAGVGYTSTTQNSWNSLANQGSDYVELIRSSYGGEYILSNPSCSFASGDWDKWRQSSSEWGSIMLSTKNMSSVGCFITAHAKAIAKSGAQVKVANFNPGTFVNTIKANGCLDGNNLVSACALKSVLVNDYERKSSALSGSLENKANVIAGYINNGYEVILRVKSPDPRQHWVLVTGVSGSTIYMSDTASDANIVVPFYNANEVVYMIAYRFDI